MFGKMNHLASRLAPKKLLLRRAVEPDARGDTVTGSEQHFYIEVEIRRGGEAGFDHGFVLGESHEPPVVRDMFVDEGGEGGLRV